MNQVLAATVIVTAILSMGLYVGSNIIDTATSSTISSNIDQQKRQEEIHVVYNGTSILLENRGKGISEIVKYRFYDKTGSLVHEVKSDELPDGTLTDDIRTLNRRVPSINSFWPNNATSGEIITSFGNVIPISFDVPSTNNRDDNNGDHRGNVNNTQTVPVGGSTLAALGVSMTIVNYDITGRLFAGDSSLIGDQHNLIPYRLVPSDTTWVSAVRDNERKKSHEVSLDGSSYRYHETSGNFNKTYHAEDWDDISFDKSVLKHLDGSPQLTHHSSTGTFPEWIKYSSSAPSTSIIKLSDDIAGTDMIFHTFLESGMSVEIVNSVYPNLHEKDYRNDKFVLFEGSASTSNKYTVSGEGCFRHKRGNIYDCFTLYNNYIFLNIGGVYTKSLDAVNIAVTPGTPHVSNLQIGADRIRSIISPTSPTINYDKIGDYYKINSISGNCQKSWKSGWGWYSFYNWGYGTRSSVGLGEGSFTIDQRHGGDIKINFYCLYTTINANIHDPSPYNILSSHNNKRECIERSYLYLGSIAPPCIRYDIGNNSIHVQSNVHLSSNGTNYMIFRYDGTSVGNVDTLLDEDHIFSYMNKFYQRTSDDTKKLTDGLAESNAFLIPHREERPIITVDNLPPNMPYEITAGDHNIVTGFTDNDGNIELYKDDDLYLISGSTDPVILSIYPDSAIYTGSIPSSVILDGFNKGSTAFDWRDDTIYVPQNYVRIVFLKQADISDVRIDDTRLSYLDKLYPANSAMHIPVIPNSDNIHMIIGGEPVEISLRYVSANTQIKVIPPQTDTDHRTSYGSPTESLSEIMSSTFFIATHNGTLTAVMDLDIAGSVSSSYSTEYKGEVKAQNRCTLDTAKRIQGQKLFGPCKTVFAGTWGTDYFTNNQPYRDVPVSSYISVYQSDYTDTINKAIQSGALGLLTVEITVFKNMELHSNDIIYIGNSAAARSSSGISEYLSAINRLELDFPSQPVKDYIEIPVSAGDIIEIIISVNTRGTGLPVPNPLLLTTVQQPPPQTRCLATSGGDCTKYDTFNVHTFSYALSQVATKAEVRSGLITLFAS